MQQSSQPTKIQLPFASSGAKNTIPVPSQASTTPGAASYTDGFPSLTMQAISAGGIPPSGKDFNGILNAITAIQQWQCGGGFFTFDSAWSSANGGYPKGAVLESAGGNDLWLNQADGNTTNPDATDGSAANWVSLASYGIASVSLTNANVTLTPAQHSKNIIWMGGSLTGNIQIILPTATREYTFLNYTSGAYTVTVKTASGSGVTIPQGQLQSVYCDGTNIVALHAPAVGNANQAFLVAAASALGHAVNLGQFSNSKVTNGYQKLPNGLILQWGASLSNTVTFPITFPNSYLMAMGTYNGSATGISVNVTGLSSSGMTVNQNTGGICVYWLAIGF